MTAGIMQVVREQRLGFVNTVNADGAPNLSPKGTFAIVDAATVAFAEIRSPATLRNLAPPRRCRSTSWTRLRAVAAACSARQASYGGGRQSSMGCFPYWPTTAA